MSKPHTHDWQYIDTMAEYACMECNAPHFTYAEELIAELRVEVHNLIYQNRDLKEDVDRLEIENAFLREDKYEQEIQSSVGSIKINIANPPKKMQQ